MKFRYLILLAIFVVSAFSIMAGNIGISLSDKRKAEYIYLEAVNQYNLENYGGMYELMGRAYELDSTNSTIAYYYGYTRLFNNGNSDEQIQANLQLMKGLVDTSSESVWETATYATLLNQFGNYTEAINLWTELQTNDPENIDIMINLVESYVNNNQLTEAIEQYKLIEENIGQLPELTMRRISLYMAMQDTANVIAEGLALLKENPQNPSYLRIMGSIYSELGEMDSTLVYLKRAEAIDPYDGYTNLDLVEYYLTVGDTINYDSQVAKLLVCRDLDVENKLKFIYEYIKDLIVTESNTDKVYNLFNILLDVHPHQGVIHELYADFLLFREDYVGATEQISYQLDQDPTNAEVWQRLMFTALMVEDYEKAKDAAETAIYYNPDNVDLYGYIASIYKHLDNYSKSIELYNIALEKVDKGDSETISNLNGGLADIYQFQGDTLNAIEYYKIALEFDAGNIYVMNNYAYLLAEMGLDLDHAEKMIRLVTMEEPKNVVYIDTYAWVLFKMERYAKALEYIELAYKLEPEHSGELLDHYGDILYMVGEVDRAVECWEKAVILGDETELIIRKINERRYIAK